MSIPKWSSIVLLFFLSITIKGQDVLYFKDSYKVNIINPYVFQGSEVLLMSFQTDINGTFNPFFTIASGTLRWIINGVEYNTNSPSVSLTGSLVNVQIWSGTTGLTPISTETRFLNDNAIGSMDFSKIQHNGIIVLDGNPLITSVSLKTGSVFSNFQINGISSASFTSIDLRYVTFSNICIVRNSPFITSLLFPSSGQISSNAQFNNLNLFSLDLSGFTFSNVLYFFSNPNLTTVTLSSGIYNIADLRGYSCNLSSFNLTNKTLTGTARLDGNVNMITVTWGSVTKALSSINVSGCALDETSIDNLFIMLNTYFSSNTPIKNLTITANGGTNSTPSATGLAAISNLTSIFTGAGFTFSYTIN